MDIQICTDCLADQFLAGKLRNTSRQGKCDLCTQNQKSIVNNDSLLELIHTAIELFFHQTSSEPQGYEYYLQKEDKWEQEGSPINVILQERVVADENIAESIRKGLENTYGVSAQDSMSMTDCPYDMLSMYEDRLLNYMPLVGQWGKFKKQLSQSSRFFNQEATEWLDSVFSGIENAQTNNGDSIIKQFSEEDETIFYRARWVYDDSELEELLKGLPNTMAAPPPDKATNGRMNAPGISVFYAALDPQTCVAEIRPPISSIVVVCEFKPTKEVKLLDFDELLKIAPQQESIFSDEYIESVKKGLFLKYLVEEIRRPVIQGVNRDEYLATQFISEYLAQYKKAQIDGVMFSSSQAKDSSVNVVLFNKSSRTKADLKMQTFDLDVSLGHLEHEGDYCDDILITQTPNLLKGMERKTVPDLSSFGIVHHRTDERAEILKCNVETVKVYRLDGITYTCSIRSLHFYDKEDDDEKYEF